MPNQTSKLSLNTFLENEAVDFELINDNFEKIDSLVLCMESGEKTATYSGAVSGNATWYYRKYSDGTMDLYTRLDIDSVKCSSGSKFPYYSGDIKLLFPVELTSVLEKQFQLSSKTIGWVQDVTDKSNKDYVLFRIISTAVESTYIFKQIFINIKGRWN